MKSQILKLLQERYFLEKEKTWNDVAERVSKIYPEIEDSIKKMEFIPSSPTLMNLNAAPERYGCSSSCFPMGLVEDSMEGIFDSLKECALVTKAGGGVGFCFDKLRGSSEIVKSIGRMSSGPLPFIKIFNSTLDGIQQSGVRRGAGMALLSIDKENILDFIDAKRDPNNQDFNRFNFSVMIPDSFYEQLKLTPNEPMMVVKNTGEKIPLKDSTGKSYSVKNLWDKIINNAQQVGEPGIFNKTLAHNQCTVTNINDIVICNPCQPSWAKVLTPEGIREFKDIDVGSKIWSKEGWTTVLKKWSTGIKEVWRYKTSYPDKDYGVFYGTKNHRVIQKGEKIEVGLADGIDVFIRDTTELDENFNVILDSEYKDIFYTKTLPFRVDSAEYHSTEEVFDITVDNESHTYWTQGCNVSNCAEYTNIPYTSCNLGSINLSKFIRYNKFDWERFGEVIEKSTIFLDRVIDNNKFPLPIIEEVTKKVRPIGLGIMSWASCLIKLGIPYVSEEAYKFADELSLFLTIKSMETSYNLRNKGVYPAFDYPTFEKANQRLLDRKKVRDIDIEKLFGKIKDKGIRNSCFTSIAPTGTISYLANTSGGIEPLFALTFTRRIEKLDGKFENVVISDETFDLFLDEFYKKDKEKILKDVSEHGGSCQNSRHMTNEHKKLFLVSKDISPKGHLSVQGIFARNTSLSVSKTVNCSADTSAEMVSEIFMKARELGIIGTTVYRDGSRGEGVLVTSPKKSGCSDISLADAPKRPKELPAEVYHYTVKRHKFFVVVGMMGCKAYETFGGENHDNQGNEFIPRSIEKGIIIKKAKSEYILVAEGKEYKLNDKHINEEQESMTRLISLSLRHGTPIKYLVQQLDRTSGDMFTFAHVLTRALKNYMNNDGEEVVGELCPACGGKIIYFEGCKKCSDSSCYWNKCGS